MRWWDGQQWGMAAPPQQAVNPFPNSQTLAVVSHLGFLAGGFILPLVIFLTANKADRYLRFHACEALNFSITVMVASLGGMALAFVGLFGAAALGGGGAAFGFFWVVWLAMMALGVCSWVFGIMGAIRASKGVWWRYPVSIRLVKDDTPAGAGG